MNFENFSRSGDSLNTPCPYQDPVLMHPKFQIRGKAQELHTHGMILMALERTMFYWKSSKRFSFYFNLET